MNAQPTVERPLAVGFTPLETRRDVVLHVAVRAEQLGYAAFSVGEGWGRDASVLLTEVALHTSTIRLGTGVLNVWGRSPASIAMLAASLSEVSGGRFDLGLGSGSPQLAEGFHDVAFRAPVERLGAVTRQVRGLLNGERMVSTVAGGSRPLKLDVPPSGEVAIHLAGLGPDAIRLCGELADGWYPFLLPASGLPDAMRLLEQGVARGLPGRAVPHVCPGLPVAVSPDPASAKALAGWWLVFYLTSMGPLYAQTLRRRGFGPAVDAVLEANPTRGTAEIPDSALPLLDELMLWGDADAARTQLDRWYAIGAEMPVIVLPPSRSVDELDYLLEVFRPR